MSAPGRPGAVTSALPTVTVSVADGLHDQGPCPSDGRHYRAICGAQTSTTDLIFWVAASTWLPQHQRRLDAAARRPVCKRCVDELAHLNALALAVTP